MRNIAKFVTTGAICAAALGTGMSTASASAIQSQRPQSQHVASQAKGVDQTAPQRVLPGTPTTMHYTSWGWTGVTVYFNKHETKEIAYGASTCLTVIPGIIAKSVCGPMVVIANYANLHNECIAVSEPGGDIWPERNHHCY